MNHQTAVLLIAHGSRRKEANEDLEFVAEQLRSRRQYDYVQASYLELCEPSIAEGGARCVSAGATCVIMVPYFLSAGLHARDDMQDAQGKLVARFPHVQFILADPLGRHPYLIDIVAARIAEVQQGGIGI